MIVTEIDPRKALEAAMDGFQVMPMAEAAKVGDISSPSPATITSFAKNISGDEGRRDRRNSGHFNDELDLDALEEMKIGKTQPRNFIDSYKLADGRSIRVLGEGRLINLGGRRRSSARGNGHVVRQSGDGGGYLAQNYKTLDKKVYSVPTRSTRKRLAQARGDAHRHRHARRPSR